MKLYRGHLDEREAAVVEVVTRQFRGGPATVVPLVHHRRHSPAGFSWGYAGAGPADLARCLLIDHLGPRAWCQACGGAGLLGPAHRLGDALDPDQCWLCLGEGTTFQPAVHQSLKHEVVAGWGDEWELAEHQVAAFLRRFGPSAAQPRHVRVLGTRLEIEGRT